MHNSLDRTTDFVTRRLRRARIKGRERRAPRVILSTRGAPDMDRGGARDYRRGRPRARGNPKRAWDVKVLGRGVARWAGERPGSAFDGAERDVSEVQDSGCSNCVPLNHA